MSILVGGHARSGSIADVRMLKKNAKARALTRAKLSEAAFISCPTLSRLQARQIVDDVFEEIASALARGESVKLSAFGAFTLRAKQARIGRNPKTGESAMISARKVVTFRASPHLVARVNCQIVQRLRG
ncbi:integration host factor subunit alpha [Methylocystis sp.]|uniref:integration host factor subunit alpha n=1 Tax=Methylocystis sp. TaxID=1911079 RepID=UPI003D1015C9